MQTHSRVLLTVSVLVLIGFSYGANRPQHSRQQVDSQYGAIAGRVLNTEGQPVSGAKVSAERSDFTMGKLPTAYTGKQGNFLIKHLAPGTYTVDAAKEEDGYPPTDSFFHSGGSVHGPQIDVYAQQVTPEVVIQLGPKAARLVGRIVDAKTNESVANVQMTLIRMDDPDHTYSTGPDLKGSFNVLVPSVPFIIKVSAPGYEDWYFRKEGSTKQADALELAPDTTREMNISLRSSKRS